MRSLTCPACKIKFTNVNISENAVRCPHCKEAMFVYRLPGDENLTPKEFFALISTRGKDIGLSIRHWFSGNVLIQTISAGQFITFVWPHLATTFKVDEELKAE